MRLGALCGKVACQNVNEYDDDYHDDKDDESNDVHCEGAGAASREEKVSCQKSTFDTFLTASSSIPVMLVITATLNCNIIINAIR